MHNFAHQLLSFGSPSSSIIVDTCLLPVTAHLSIHTDIHTHKHASAVALYLYSTDAPMVMVVVE
jgi:hypothetical protein